jgi:hypothetical protein
VKYLTHDADPRLVIVGLLALAAAVIGLLAYICGVGRKRRKGKRGDDEHL